MSTKDFPPIKIPTKKIDQLENCGHGILLNPTERNVFFLLFWKSFHFGKENSFPKLPIISRFSAKKQKKKILTTTLKTNPENKLAPPKKQVLRILGTFIIIPGIYIYIYIKLDFSMHYIITESIDDFPSNQTRGKSYSEHVPFR